MSSDENNPTKPIKVEYENHVFADADLWANAKILTTTLAEEFKEMQQYNPEAALKVANLAAALPTPLFLMNFYSTQVEIAFSIMKDQKRSPEERRDKAQKLEEMINKFQKKANILALTSSLYVDYFMSAQYSGKHPDSIPHAIAQVVEQTRPEPPKQWPPKTEAEKRAMIDLDISLHAQGSDALAQADNSACRHANALTLDICELRGLNPYTCVMSLQRGEDKSGHFISVIYEDGNKNNPIFIDGHNNIVARSFEELRACWQRIGWSITKCEAVRLVVASRDTQTTDTNFIGSRWDEIRYK